MVMDDDFCPTLSTKTARAVAHVLDTLEVSYTDHCTDIQVSATEAGLDLDKSWNVRKDLWRMVVGAFINEIVDVGVENEMWNHDCPYSKAQLVSMVEKRMSSMLSA